MRPSPPRVARTAPRSSPTDPAVQEHVASLARAEGVELVRSYCINPTMPELAARAEAILGHEPEAV